MKQNDFRNAAKTIKWKTYNIKQFVKKILIKNALANVTIICRVRNMANSRLNKSIKNTIIGIIFTMLNLIFQFSVKSVFIKLLGETYNGVNGLFPPFCRCLILPNLGLQAQ